MDIGDKYFFVIDGREREFECTAKKHVTDYEGLPDVECELTCTDDPNLKRWCPEWLVDAE